MCEGEGSEDKEGGGSVLGLDGLVECQFQRMILGIRRRADLVASERQEDPCRYLGLSCDADPRICIPDIEYI